MKNSKILVSVKNLDELKEYKKIGITNFLFALKGFSIGYPEFTLDELLDLDINVYLNINLVMDTKKINEFKNIISKLDFVKGIFFEDLGIYYVLKDHHIPLIWNQNHFVINSVSINSWLNRVTSACLTNELTKEEIKYILEKTSKPLILPIFGYNIAMYSRRYLLSNFNRYHGYKIVNNGYLKINPQNQFKAYETENGTVLFYHKPFNYYPIINELKDEKIWFYYFDLTHSNIAQYHKIINNEISDSEERFLNHKTIYKLED
ncbi:MAG: hypothetical protein GX265_04410 [Mollicutes bacterium]|nr:hypothetical protein [Mollicutes bacterium]